jgi:hypothetical protein
VGDMNVLKRMSYAHRIRRHHEVKVVNKRRAWGVSVRHGDLEGYDPGAGPCDRAVGLGSRCAPQTAPLSRIFMRFQNIPQNARRIQELSTFCFGNRVGGVMLHRHPPKPKHG